MTCTASGCQTLPLVEPPWTLQLFTVITVAGGVIRDSLSGGLSIAPDNKNLPGCRKSSLGQVK